MPEDIHVFKGLRRDNHPIKQDGSFLWDAHNIRITPRDGNTLLSVTNEKSTKPLLSFDNESYIGHAIADKWLILFTKGETKDTIYRIDLSTDTPEKVILYKDNLNFNTDYPAQTLVDQEAATIIKVYWVDGINRPRVINIMKPELTEAHIEKEDNGIISYTHVYNDAPFDFVQDLKLDENIEISRVENSSGIFPAGVIQYAFTYCFKYGQESNIFYTSELLNLSYKDRGASPEDTVTNAFKIVIEKPDTKFDFIRVYSIIRTSIDAQPVVKRIVDLDIKKDSTYNTIVFVDNNTTGDNVDPISLLYKGGKDVIANTLTSKDNTLFLGNIEYKNKAVSVIEINDSTLKEEVKRLSVSTDVRNIDLGSNLQYSNQLFTNTSTFKCNEKYRLGIQFQSTTGEWSEPLYIKDIPMDKNPKFTVIDSNTVLQLPVFKTVIPNNISSILINNKYIRARGVIVYPTNNDKNILAQGILCPTVFNAGNREANAPYSQSSWLLRPTLNSTTRLENVLNSNSDAPINGEPVEFRHYKSLVSGVTRKAEIQSMYLHDDTLPIAYDSIKENNKVKRDYYSQYFVDRSILTFHSPDIEFDDTIQNIINNNNSLKVNIVGKVYFSSNEGNMDLQVSSTGIDVEAAGIITHPVKGLGDESLVSNTYYEDGIVDEEKKNPSNIYQYPYKGAMKWMVHLWHRSGSLNNDIVRPEGSGKRTSVLKTKVVANIKKSILTSFDSSINKDLGNPELHLFNSNEIEAIKFKNNDIYYGNVDTLVTSTKGYNLICDGDVTSINITNPYIDLLYGKVDDGYGPQDTQFTVDNINAYAAGNSGEYNISGTIINTPVIIYHSSSGNDEEGNPIITTSNLSLQNATISFVKQSNGTYKGTVRTTDGISLTVSGTTDYTPKFSTFQGTGIRRLTTVEAAFKEVGDALDTLKWPKEGVRIKYKSTPHVVVKLNNNILDDTADSKGPYLYLAEIVRNNAITNRFGGDSDEAIRNNLWFAAGKPVRLDSNKPIVWEYGDTWYQRYECLKTYPFTNEDENRVIEIGSFFCETRVNIDGRYDRNKNSISNLYISPNIFNLINPVYSQKNTFFNYRILDKDYYNINKYSTQILWSNVKNPAAIQDNWTNIHAASSYDLDGTNGPLNALITWNDTILSFQDKSVSNILYNSRVQIPVSDGVPIEIANGAKVEGVRPYSNTIGCQDKFSITSTPRGVYFIDNLNSNIYLFNGNLNDIGLQLGSLYWTRDNISGTTWKYKTTDSINNSIRLSYDPKYQDVYFTPGLDNYNREALCYSEQVGQFTSFFNYTGAVMFPCRSKYYSIADDETGTMTLWKNFSEEGYNHIFNRECPYSISFISNDNPTVTKIFDTINLRADLYLRAELQDDGITHTRQVGKPFNYINVTNEYQTTEDVKFTDTTLRKKFRVWRGLIPRQHNTRNRIRNPWAKITLGMTNPGNNYTILHDLSVIYTI